VTVSLWSGESSSTVAADEVGLPELRLQVHFLGILIPLYYGDSNAALRMATETSELGDSQKNRSSPAYSLAVTLKALIQAQIGLKGKAQRTLEDSGELFGRLLAQIGPSRSLVFPNVAGASIVLVPWPNWETLRQHGRHRTKLWNYIPLTSSAIRP